MRSQFTSQNETIYKLKSGVNGRFWFVGNNENDIWVWDRNNQNGIMGDKRLFRIGEGDMAFVEVFGPWCSNKDSLRKETGYDFDQDSCSLHDNKRLG